MSLALCHQCISSHTFHKWEHDHHALPEYAFSDVFQKGLQCDKWHKKTGGRMDGCALRFVGQVGPNLPRMYAQICRVCMPKSAAQNETLDGDIEDRCEGGLVKDQTFSGYFFATFPKNNLWNQLFQSSLSLPKVFLIILGTRSVTTLMTWILLVLRQPWILLTLPQNPALCKPNHYLCHHN